MTADQLSQGLFRMPMRDSPEQAAPSQSNRSRGHFYGSTLIMATPFQYLAQEGGDATAFLRREPCDYDTFRNVICVNSYNLSAKAIYDSGSVVSSAAASVTVTASTSSSLTFAATSGTLSAPFFVTNGAAIVQPVYILSGSTSTRSPRTRS